MSSGTSGTDPSMAELPRASRRRGTIRVGIALLSILGPSACGLARPFLRASDANGASESRPAAQVTTDAGEPSPKSAGPYLLLRLGERRLYLMDDDPGTPVESFPIAVGREGMETPTGEFRVEEMVEDPDFLVIDKEDRARVARRIPPGPGNPLGARWIGFAHGDGWTVGIHGTPHPDLLGRAVSRGCVRMRNADVIRIYDRVRLGTTVIVAP
jgi:hypothetical protein